MGKDAYSEEDLEFNFTVETTVKNNMSSSGYVVLNIMLLAMKCAIQQWMIMKIKKKYVCMFCQERIIINF